MLSCPGLTLDALNVTFGLARGLLNVKDGETVTSGFGNTFLPGDVLLAMPLGVAAGEGEALLGVTHVDAEGAYVCDLGVPPGLIMSRGCRAVIRPWRRRRKYSLYSSFERTTQNSKANAGASMPMTASSICMLDPWNRSRPTTGDGVNLPTPEVDGVVADAIAPLVRSTAGFQ